MQIKLKGILSERGMSQKELAELTGLPASAISNMVSNQRQKINKQQLMRVCEALNIKRIEYILELVKGR